MIAALLLVAATALPGKGQPPISAQTQRSGGVRPAAQQSVRFDSADLSFDVDVAHRRIAGRAALAFTITRPTDRLIVDLDSNFAVRAVTLDGAALPAARLSRPDGQIVVSGSFTPGARVALVIEYDGTPHVAVNAPWDDGMVWSQTPDGRPWVASTTEGYGCDILWPCLDFPTAEPGEATLHITVPQGLKAPSNGRLLGVETLADGRTRWNWHARHPNTYAIALNIAPYEELSGTYRSRFGNTIPLHYWYLPGQRAKAEALFAEFAPTLDFFERVIGPYPFGDEKLGVVETPHKGMEHQTINAYGNGYAKAPEGFDWLFHHEFAHEWFGNQLTAADWDDYWLHEGFASYMQPLYGRWREGDYRYHVMLEAQRNQIVAGHPIVSGGARTEEEVYEAGKNGPGTDIYYKGSWALHTLRGLIGDAAFFRAIRLTVYGRADPQPGNFTPRYGTTAEFEANVATAAGRDLAWFFDAYLRRADLPDLVEQRSERGLSLAWRAGGPFPMPVEVDVDGRRERVAMADGHGFIAASPEAHIVIDPEKRILRRSPAVEAFRQWQREQRR